MRLQQINLTTFDYRAYLGKREKLTEDGRHTGINEPEYDAPVQYEGNISVPYGYAAQQMFGLDTRYTHILVMEDPEADIHEYGLIDWKGDTYEIQAVRPSFNYMQVALRKMSRTGQAV